MIRFSKLIIYVWINYSSINAEKISYRHTKCCFINDSFPCDYINVSGSVFYCLRGVIPSYLNSNSHTQYPTCRSCYQFGTLYSIYAIKLKRTIPNCWTKWSHEHQIMNNECNYLEATYIGLALFRGHFDVSVSCIYTDIQYWEYSGLYLNWQELSGFQH